MEPLRAALQALLRPREAFAGMAWEPGRSRRAFGRMLLWWLPPALIHGALSAWSALATYRTLQAGHLPAWLSHWILPGLDPDSTVAFLKDLPAPPDPRHLALLVLLLVPVGVVGTWLHDAVWDHTALWMLRGLREKRGFRATLLAESRALRIASLGTWVGLLGFLPVAGAPLALPLALLEGYLWIFRGFALAEAHGLPAWKGIAATVLHAALLGIFALIVLGMMLALFAAAG